MVITCIEKIRHSILCVICAVYLRDITRFFFFNFALACESSEHLLFLLIHMKNMSLCTDQCNADLPSARMWQKCSDFFGHYKYDKCKTMLDGSTH